MISSMSGKGYETSNFSKTKEKFASVFFNKLRGIQPAAINLFCLSCFLRIFAVESRRFFKEIICENKAFLSGWLSLLN